MHAPRFSAGFMRAAPAGTFKRKAALAKEFAALATQYAVYEETIAAHRPKCVVRPSERHGNGVFATESIKKGENITYYPAHGIRFWLPKRYAKSAKPLELGCSADKTRHSVFYDDYTMTTRSLTGSRVGVKLTGFGDVAVPCGHLINEALPLTDFPSTLSPAKVVARLRTYVNLAPKMANADHHQGASAFLYPIVAARDIEPGEEILIHYGPSYWLARLNPENPNNRMVNNALAAWQGAALLP